MESGGGVASELLGISEQFPGLYRRLLGADWPQLAEPIRHAHTVLVESHGRGLFRIERGRHWLARAFGWILRLPPASAESEAHLTVTLEAEGELWVRRFGARRIVTYQYQAGPQVFAERFGIVEFRFRLEVAEGHLVFHQRGVTLLGVPIPESLAPTIQALEEPGSVSVRISIPVGGLLLSYQGIVEYSVEKL